MATLKLANINKIYPGGVQAVYDFNLEIGDREFIVLVGPSGCGKSTTLRMIAGLEEISSGELYIDGRLMNQVQPKDRDIAMVFQSYALYPHMTVFDNIAFGLRMRKLPKGEIKRRVEAAAKILELENLLDRKPGALSGGQRQRVALGRAIVRNPKVFLLDEPLSNLDAKLRTSMRTEISKLHKQLGSTFIYVTHDQTEAMTMGTRIVLMRDGVVQQVDTPQMIFDRPQNLFVATFIGTPQMNVIPVLLTEEEGALYVSFGGEEALHLPLPREKAEMPRVRELVGRQLLMGIRPNDIYLDEAGFECQVQINELQGADRNLYLKRGDAAFMTQASVRALPQLRERISVRFDMEMAHLFDPETEETLTV